MSALKGGRFSMEERATIESYAASLTPEEIGEELERDPKSIRKYIVEKLGLTPVEAMRIPSPITPPDSPPQVVRRPEPVERAAISSEFRRTELWKRLSDGFEPDELKYLEERYIVMVTQFEDVVATEETQILQAIKLEILMDRNLAQRKKALQSIRIIEEAQAELLEDYCPGGSRSNLTKEQIQELLNVETQLNAARSDEQSRTAEYDKLGAQHEKLMKALKATRDQRLDKVKTNKDGFLDVIRMLQEKDLQEIEGRQMELMKLASEKELVRLGRPIVYDDGNQDNPILCPETVGLSPEEVSEDGE